MTQQTLEQLITRKKEIDNELQNKLHVSKVTELIREKQILDRKIKEAKQRTDKRTILIQRKQHLETTIPERQRKLSFDTAYLDSLHRELEHINTKLQP